MQWTTKMSAYKQFVTTTYDRTNGSILNIKVTSDPEPMYLNASHYRVLWNKLVVPSPTSLSSTTEISQLNSFVYALTWMHRTYAVSFPDERGVPITYLHNFLAI